MPSSPTSYRPIRGTKYAALRPQMTERLRAPLGRRRGNNGSRPRRDHSRLGRHRVVPDHDHSGHPRTPGAGHAEGEEAPPAGVEPPARWRRQAPDPDRPDAFSWPTWTPWSSRARAATRSRRCAGPARAPASWPSSSGPRAIGSASGRWRPCSRGGATAYRATARPGRGARTPTATPSSGTSPGASARSSGGGSRSSRSMRRRRNSSVTTRTAAGSGVPPGRPRR